MTDLNQTNKNSSTKIEAITAREYANSLNTLKMFSKAISEFPLQIIFPTLFSLILYNLAGLRDSTSAFFIFAMTMIFQATIGMAFGFLVTSITEDLGAALSIAPVTLMPLLLFSGFLKDLDSLWGPLYYVQFVNPMAYSFAILFDNQFTDSSKYHCESDEKILGNCPLTDGEQIRQLYGFEDVSILNNSLILLGMVVFLMILSSALVVRRVKSRKE